MKWIKISQLLILSFILFSCKSNNGKTTISDVDTINTVEQQKEKSSSQQLMSNLKYDKYVIEKDTLIISSDDDFLDYPFGCFKQVSDLSHRLNYLKHKQEVYQEYGEEVKLERFYSDNSFIKFYLVERFIDNKTRYEIVSARIFDEEIILSNGIHVGITRSDFFSSLPESIKGDMSGIRVVKIFWDVLGITHYYYISNTLTSIIIDTDFLVNKN